jgi:hypothetical protein
LAKKLGFGALGTIASAFFYVLLNIPPLFQPWAARSDILMIPFLLLSLESSLDPKGRGDLRSGFWWAAAFFTKQSAVFFLPIFWVPGAFRSKDKVFRWIGGAVLATLLVLSPFLFQGGLGPFWAANVGFNRSYVQSGWRFFGAMDQFRSFELRWLGSALLTYGSPLLAFILLWRKKPAQGISTRTFLSLWFLCALASCCASGYFFSYYFVALLPPLALVLGSEFSKAWIEKKVAYLPYFGVMVFGAGLIGLNAFSLRNEIFKMAQYPTDRYEAEKALGLGVRSLAGPQDRLLAWNCDPQDYVYAGLRSSVKTPFINHLKALPEEWAGLQTRLTKESPRFCLVSRDPQVIPPPDWLEGLLKGQYSKLRTMADLELYVRKEKLK